MKTIGLVEDNPDNRLLILVMLEDIYEIIEFGSGKSALAGFSPSKPDLVPLDISMPEMDGPEVLRIRQPNRVETQDIAHDML